MGRRQWLTDHIPERLRPTFRLAYRSLNRTGEAIPSRLPSTAPSPVHVYGVYRHANAGALKEALQGLPIGSAVSLHALDDAAEVLRKHTVSVGPGLRMPLLQDLITRRPPTDGNGVLLVDDDIAFTPPRTLGHFIRVAELAGLDVAQPAHTRTSTRTFPLNGVDYLSTARLSTFVEVGPVVLLSPRVLDRVIPFPPESGMGWGVDVLWTTLPAAGFRLGVVDAAPVQHLGSVAVGYDVTKEHAYLRACLNAVGAGSIEELAPMTTACWRRWTASPPWGNPAKERGHPPALGAWRP